MRQAYKPEPQVMELIGMGSPLSRQQKMSSPLAVAEEVRLNNRDRSGVGSPRLWIPALLLFFFAGQSLWFVAMQSLIFDEE